MRTMRSIRILALSGLAIGISWAGWHLDRSAPVLAEPQATITITQPDGLDDVVGNGDDFATTVLGDPWDMSEHTDIPALHGVPGGTIDNGLLTYTLTPPNTHIPLLYPGALGAIDAGIKVGSNHTIDTATYKWLSFRLNHPTTGRIYIRWYYDKNLSGNYGATEAIPISQGWYTYVIDLESIGKLYGSSWTGQVQGLYVSINSAANGTGMIDWARLTADNPASNSLDISWSGLSPTSSKVEFYLDSKATSCDGTLIYAESSAQESGSFTWQQAGDDVASPANVAPGDYYVCAKVNGSEAGYSSGQLTVNHAPIIHFIQPSFTSGEDYATDAGNPWDMDDAADIDYVANGSYTVDGGVLVVTVPASKSDVQVYLNVPTAIDRDRYYYLTYRLWFDYDYTLGVDVGQGTRIFWGREDPEAQSGWIYDYPGWQTYSIDLRSLPLDFGPTWDTAAWTVFRIDPVANATGQNVTVYLDDITLTGDEEADTYANIEWRLTDPDSSVTTLALYYDDDKSGLDGTRVVTLTLTNGEQAGLAVSSTESSAPLHATNRLTETVYLPLVVRSYSVPCTGACYTWYANGVPAGAYYLYACMDDGHNVLCRYSETPLQVSHP